MTPTKQQRSLDVRSNNREFSYGMGNQVLIEISSMLRLFIEKDECFARMEADSFVLMLYYQNIPALERRLVQLVDHVEHLAARVNLPFQMVCMAGVAWWMTENLRWKIVSNGQT